MSRTEFELVHSEIISQLNYYSSMFADLELFILTRSISSRQTGEGACNSVLVQCIRRNPNMAVKFGDSLYGINLRLTPEKLGVHIVIQHTATVT